MTKGVQCLRVSAYISDKAPVPVLQLICYTFGTLKIFPNLKWTARLVYIVTQRRRNRGQGGFNPPPTFLDL